MTNEQQLAASREPVDQLADEFLGRFRQGERPSITDYVRAHPDLAAEIRDLFPTLVLLEQLGPRPEEVAGRQIGADPTREIPQNLGEYRILREVGRGGMGIVYEAEQLPLGRHVALKVLPSSAVLNPSVLTRFQNEVRAAARLHHTNIVPVFDVGEYQGTHYYAMQFIAGQGLDVVLAELRRQRRNEPAPDAASTKGAEVHGPQTTAPAPSSVTAQDSRGNSTSHGTSLSEYFQAVARMGLQVAEALAHAHGQGVLHRDIKPSNLLLDAQGCVWVTDFGLAKQAGCDVTNTGDVVGTLRYLAPERFQGTSDARTDVYGLGVTLYELLTTQPAFDATDRGRLVYDIVHTDPLPLRRLERRVPRDLETIVLKAMAKDPSERYASPADMATDLRRFLDDKPIGARRRSFRERVWRWCVRRPALASLATALVFSLAIGVASVCWQWVRAETNLKEAQRQQDIARRQRAIAEQEATRAEDNYQTAHKSVNELLMLVSEDELMDQPGLQPLRLRLLTKALEFHEKMLADRDQDPAALRDLAEGYLRMGMLKRQMGPVTEAAEFYHRAIKLLETADAAGSGRETAVLLVKAYNSVALHYIDQRNEALARALLEQARSRIDRVLAEAADDDAVQQASAMTFNNQAYFLSESKGLDLQSRNEDAIRLNEQALGIYRRLAERQPADWALQ
jgi:serine/threonine protein kinase